MIEAGLEEGYSGRGMYGATTTAVTVESTMDVEEARRLCRVLRNTRVDSLGLGAVFY